MGRRQAVSTASIEDDLSAIVACFYELSLDLWITDEWDPAFAKTLEFLQRQLGANESALFLKLPGDQEPRLICSPGVSGRLRAELEHRLREEPVDADTRCGHLQALPIPSTPGRTNWLVVPERTATDARYWIDEFTRQLGRVLVVVSKVFRVRRQDLYEERATISRELHDSLAQSLTYLKIQISRLEASLKDSLKETGDSRHKTEAIVGELRNRLNRAYRELRELMTTFRLTMHGKSFNMAVEELIKETEQFSSIAFTLDNRLEEDCLSVDEEMQLFQIIRESLFNIVQHSKASNTVIKLARNGNDEADVHLQISDDGIGPDRPQARARHHGLLIMQERAFGLNGQFNVDQNERGGTTIDVRFRPGAGRNETSRRPVPETPP